MECQQNYKEKTSILQNFRIYIQLKKIYAAENNRSKYKASGVVSSY